MNKINEHEYELDNRDLRTTELHANEVTVVVDPVELLENAIENSDPSEEVLQAMSALWRLLGLKPEE